MTVVQTPADTRPAPVEVTSPIKPSEALRLGRLVRPTEAEVYETLFAGDDRACALGAMALGYGFNPERQDPTFAYEWVASRTGWSYDSDETSTGPDGSLRSVWSRFDRARMRGESGDAAVLAYLEARGL